MTKTISCNYDAVIKPRLFQRLQKRHMLKASVCKQICELHIRCTGIA
jgi:hypothetical protein